MTDRNEHAGNSVGELSTGELWARFRRKRGMGPKPDLAAIAAERYMPGPMRAVYEEGLRQGYLLGRARTK